MNERKSSNPCPLLAHQPFLEKFQSTSHQSSSSPPLTLIHTTTTTYNIIPTTTTTPTSPQSKMKSFPRSETFLMLNEFIHQVNSCGFPVLVFNRHFMIEFLNKEAEELFGVYSFAVMGEYLSELLVMDSLNEIRNAIENYLGEDHHTHRHPCDMMQHDQVEETNHPYEIMKPSTSESNMEDSMNDDEESEFDDRRTSITSWQSCHSFNLQLPNIEHIERISTEERKARKQDLMNTRSLTGRASTLKKIFPMKVRLLPLHKTDQTHFAAYIQEVKQSDEDSKHLHGVQFGEAVTELSVIPIIAINKKGIIQFFNSAACSAFKYSKQEIVGKNVKILCPPKIRAQHDKYLERYLKTGEKHVVDSVRMVKGVVNGGKIIRMELRVSEIFDPVTNESSFVAFVRDCTSMATREEHLTNIAERIFPKNIAQRLTLGQQVIDSLQKCSMLFCDIVGFTDFSSNQPASTVVKILHQMFTSFDEISTCYHLEKIKTIGDSYFAATGIVKETDQDAENCVRAALEMIRSIQEIEMTRPENITNGLSNIQVRIGIHTGNSGDVTAAVVGRLKKTYDLFGTGVTTTQLMEATGKANQIHISENTYREIESDSLKALFVPYFQAKEEVYLPDKLGMKSIPFQTFITDI
nr:unnamed protein product [Naegleria fowleri]